MSLLSTAINQSRNLSTQNFAVSRRVKRQMRPIPSTERLAQLYTQCEKQKLKRFSKVEKVIGTVQVSDLAAAVLGHEGQALAVRVVVAVLALQALLEEAAEQLLAVAAHRGPRVRVHRERVRDAQRAPRARQRARARRPRLRARGSERADNCLPGDWLARPKRYGRNET